MYSEDDIESVNGFQACGWFHPYTCDCGETLIAKPKGLYCPVHGQQHAPFDKMTLNNEWKKYEPGLWFKGNK